MFNQNQQKLLFQKGADFYDNYLTISDVLNLAFHHPVHNSKERNALRYITVCLCVGLATAQMIYVVVVADVPVLLFP